jgi:hypothetical protein
MNKDNPWPRPVEPVWPRRPVVPRYDLRAWTERRAREPAALNARDWLGRQRFDDLEPAA